MNNQKLNIKALSRLTSLLLCLCLVAACSGVQYHKNAVNSDEGEKLTVGTVQKEIREGMSGAEVAAVLGSPNIVTTDEERREVWVYDKISTQRAYSTESGGISSLILGGWAGGSGAAGGGLSTGYGSGSGAAATTQKTLTVIIKFDKSNKVRDFAYHTSTF